MSFAASRVMLRQSTSAVRRAGVRNASSTSDAAAAAKKKAADAQSRAIEGLSRVTSSAGTVITKVGSSAVGALGTLGKVGGRTGRLVGRIQSLVPPTIYYSKVGLELGKLVFQQRKMSPPDMATFQSYFQSFFTRLVKNPTSVLSQAAQTGAAQPANILSRVRNLSPAQWASAGVVTAEIIGFFSVGEMIGRFKIVGYRSSASDHH